MHSVGVYPFRLGNTYFDRAFLVVLDWRVWDIFYLGLDRVFVDISVKTMRTSNLVRFAGSLHKIDPIDVRAGFTVGIAVKQPNPESAADEVGAGTTGNAEFSEHAAAEDDVWLKKRLVESVGSAVFPLEEVGYIESSLLTQRDTWRCAWLRVALRWMTWVRWRMDASVVMVLRFVATHNHLT